MAMEVKRLNHRVNDPRAWTRSAAGDRELGRRTLPEECGELIAGVLEAWRRDPGSVAEVRLDASQRSAGKQALLPLLDQLKTGCGFVVLDEVHADGWVQDEIKLAYWLIGQMIGAPWSEHSMFDNVLNTGANLVIDEGVSFHTDASFLDTPPEYIGLLCLRPARSGGENRMLSAYSLHNAILDRYPHLLDTLYQPFYFDRRGQFSPGEATTFDYPVFDWNGTDLAIRYFNQDIQLGHRNAARPTTPLQCEALEAVENILEDEDLYVEFMLRPGQSLWANNRWMLHKRNGYLDHKRLEQRRHFVRMYLLR